MDADPQIPQGESIPRLLDALEKQAGGCGPMSELVNRLRAQVEGALLPRMESLEKELDASKARHRRLNESMREGFAVVDMAGRYLEVNEAYQQMVGYTAEELASLSYADLTPEKWHAFERKIIEEQVIPRGYSDVYQKEYRRKDGTTYPVELRTILMRDAAGNPAAMGGIIRDITARKRAEDALRDSEERFRSFFADAAIGIAVTAPEGRLVQVNPAFCEFLGYTERELVGKTIAEITDPSDLDASIATMRESLAGKSRIRRFEKRYIRKDGQSRWAEVTTTLVGDRSGKPKYFVAQVADISERKQAEEALRRMREELEERVRQRTADVAWLQGTINRSPVVAFRSRAGTSYAERLTENISLLGYSAAEFLSRRRSWISIIHADDRNRVQAEMDEIASRGTPECRLHYRIIDGSGQVKWLEDRTRIIVDPKSGDRHYEGVIFDVTEQRLAEERLRSSDERNRRLIMELDHRVRNNIAGLLGLISVMKHRTPDVDSFAAAIEGRLTAMGHIHRFLADSHWGPVDLRSLVVSTLKAMMPLSAWPADLSIEGPTVNLHPGRVMPITLILFEWFTNSCKHGAQTGPGGRLSISWEVGDNRVRFTWKERGGPLIENPVIPSLGTEVVQGLATLELRGRCTLGYPVEGAEHLLEFPIVATTGE